MTTLAFTTMAEAIDGLALALFLSVCVSVCVICYTAIQVARIKHHYPEWKERQERIDSREQRSKSETGFFNR